jgi:inner membrane protein
MAVLVNNALTKSNVLPPRTSELGSQEQSSKNKSFQRTTSWFTSLANRIDIRLLLIGSLLPDIIDKPVGHFFFPDTFGTGRIFCHTLLFLILITLGGLYLYWSRKKTWLLVLSFGTFTHLILDGMWLHPKTLLWPLYGLSFERICLENWIENMLYDLLHQPVLIIPELTGAVIIIWFVLLLARRGKLYAFLRRGQV